VVALHVRMGQMRPALFKPCPGARLPCL